MGAGWDGGGRGKEWRMYGEREGKGGGGGWIERGQPAGLVGGRELV